MRALWVTPLWVTMLLAFTLALGCKDHGSAGKTVAGGTADASGGATDATSTQGGTTTQSNSAGGHSGGAGTGGNGGYAGLSSASSSVGRTCSADCFMRPLYRCSSEHTSYQPWKLGDCHSICGPGPCDGYSCQQDGAPIACPEGTRCMDGLDTGNPCQPVNDAGAVVPDAAAKRCAGLYVETLSETGQWKTSETCLYSCSGGACSGTCFPESQRCRPGAGENMPQVCSPQGTWWDTAACPASAPTCINGKCVASCLQTGKDCTDPKTTCCPGSQCLATNSPPTTFACKAIPACAALGGACSATTDCCAGMDCASGKCVARNVTCRERPEDGVCGGSSGGTCCPGTACRSDLGYSPPESRCALPSNTVPQEDTCPRDRPYQREECSAASFASKCMYSDSNRRGIFYQCVCLYHGWWCEEGRQVHGLNPDETP